MTKARTRDSGLRICSLLLLCWIAFAAAAQEPITDMGITQQSEEAMQWFRDAKYGMFLHWGLYAVPAKGEWYMEKAAVPIEEYRKYAFDQGDGVYFDANQYDPNRWAQIAKAAGMKYICLTARHHDGFALFDSKHPNAFTSLQTLKRDLYREYVDACRKAGLRVGLYYSPMSWRYPGYYDVTGTNCDRNNWNYKTDPAHKEDARLMKEEVYEQVRTLFKHYGPFDYVYWDGAWLAQRPSDREAAFFWEPGKYRDPNNAWPVAEEFSDFDETGRALGLMGIARKYSPNVMVTKRSGWIGDFVEREGTKMDKGPIVKGRPWERNMNFNSASWGYNSRQKCLSYEQLVEHFTNVLIRDGNLLLNFGPDRHGRIPEDHVEVVLRMGQWLKQVADAVYGTRAGLWDPVDGKYGFTHKEGTIFVHLLAGYKGTTFTTPPIKKKVARCCDLYQKKDLDYEHKPDGSVCITGVDRSKHPPNTVLAVYLRPD